MQPIDQPLFLSVQDAVQFATNFNHQVTPRSSMLQMASPSTGSGTGLSGLDGAGQAGIILSEVRELATPLQGLTLIARTAPHYKICNCGTPCCSRKVVNWEWMECVSSIVTILHEQQEANRESGKRGVEYNIRLWRSLVCKFYGEKTTLEDIAKSCEVSANTVTSHMKLIDPSLKREEREGWNNLDNRLRDIGLVGEPL